MIYAAMQFIGDALNTYLQTQFAITENKVVLNQLINTDGTIPAINGNKIVLTLINLEEDKILRNTIQIKNHGAGTPASNSKYAVYILLSSNFNEYPESLKFLATALDFFHNNTVFNESSANFPPNLTSLQAEIFPLSFENISSIWTATGAGYLPSVVIKASLILKNQ